MNNNSPPPHITHQLFSDILLTLYIQFSTLISITKFQQNVYQEGLAKFRIDLGGGKYDLFY